LTAKRDCHHTYKKYTASPRELANTKATDGTTLLDYIVRWVHERGEADLLAVRDELPSLDAACSLDEPMLLIEVHIGIWYEVVGGSLRRPFTLAAIGVGMWAVG
jgi:hypothetical protein